MDALRLNCGWYGSGLETSGQLGSVVNACLAVASGLANHVLCFRSVWEGSAQGDKGRSGGDARRRGGGGGSFKASGFMSWNIVFSAPSAAIWIAMFAQRHFHEYGTTREQLAWIAAERPQERRGQPERDLPRPDVVRRLHERAHDLDAVLPLRLRRPVRRRDRGDRVAARAREGSAARAAARRGGRDADRGPPVVGPVRRSLGDAEPRRRQAAVGAHRLEAIGRADGPALRRLLVAHDVVARGARLVRRRRGRPVHRRRRRASPATASSRSTRTAASCRPDGCTATASCTRARPRCGAKPATVRSQHRPR